MCVYIIKQHLIFPFGLYLSEYVVMSRFLNVAHVMTASDKRTS